MEIFPAVWTDFLIDLFQGIQFRNWQHMALEEDAGKIGFYPQLELRVLLKSMPVCTVRNYIQAQ